ncbi:MAG: hypothetical protein LBS03_10500 [Bacteroidales bacterium]|nr:hypothetical protein [Bacteroidales bacterium]
MKTNRSKKLLQLTMVALCTACNPAPDRTKDFLHPPAKYRFHLMAHNLTQKTDPGAYLDTLKAKGVSGVVINYPANFLKDSTYLQDAAGWQSLNRTVKMLKEKGVLVWLYDELGFPSGDAGGLVLEEDSAYEATGIVLLKTKAAENRQKPDDVLEVIYEYRHGDEHYTVCTLRLFEGTAAAANYGRPYINIADKKAVDAFIRITHDAYYRNMENMSDNIDAIFTDEPGLMEGYIDAERSYPEGHKYAPVSWVTGLEKRFERQHGYDLMPKIHCLFEGDDEQARIVRIHYRQTLASFVSDAYFQNISDWCGAHGIKSSGHINNEEFIHEHVAYYGNLFTTLDKMDWIGCDVIRGTYSRYMGERRYIGPKYIGSLARIRNKAETVMVELCPIEIVFGADHEITDGQLRAIANLLWLSGCNYLNSYREVERISDPAAFSDYLGRMGYLLDGAVHDSKTGVYYPTETVQALYKPLHTVHMKHRAETEEIGKLEKALQHLTMELWHHQCDYDFLDAQAIEEAEIADGALHIAGMEFKVIVMSHVQVVPLKVLKKLELFEKAGGKVIWTGWLPQHGVHPDETAYIAGYAQSVRLSENPVAETVSAVNDRMQWDGEAKPIVSRFVKDGKPLYMVINNTDSPIEVQGSYAGATGYRLFDPSNGNIAKSDVCRFRLDPYSAMFVLIK